MNYKLDLRAIAFISALIFPQISTAESIQLPELDISEFQINKLPELSGVLLDENGTELRNGETITTVNSKELLSLIGASKSAPSFKRQLEKAKTPIAGVNDLLTTMSAPPQYSLSVVLILLA